MLSLAGLTKPGRQSTLHGACQLASWLQGGGRSTRSCQEDDSQPLSMRDPAVSLTVVHAEVVHPAKQSFYSLSSRPPTSMQPHTAQPSTAARPSPAAVPVSHRPPAPRKASKPALGQHDEDVSCPQALMPLLGAPVTAYLLVSSTQQPSLSSVPYLGPKRGKWPVSRHCSWQDPQPACDGAQVSS